VGHQAYQRGNSGYLLQLAYIYLFCEHHQLVLLICRPFLTLHNGMSEHDVMVLTDHASFTVIHEFYLVITDDLIIRAGAATEQCLYQKIGAFWCR
jgi:hypothetical protein